MKSETKLEIEDWRVNEYEKWRKKKRQKIIDKGENNVTSTEKWAQRKLMINMERRENLMRKHVKGESKIRQKRKDKWGDKEGTWKLFSKCGKQLKRKWMRSKETEWKNKGKMEEEVKR